MDKIADNRLYIYVGIIILLAIPALLINLGLQTYINDEAIRALVALEMDYSGNFIVPTVNGSYYYSKPPVYNWLIHLSFMVFGKANELASRMPTVICLSLFCFTIYRVNRPHFKHVKYPILIALFYLTCGRIMFWDSFRGLIDIGFSWVVYLMFIAVYYFGTKQKYWHMYIAAYVLAAIAYLLKGLPAFVFVGFTMLAYHYINKSLKKIISIPHIVGGLCMVAIIGGYYILYGAYNESTAVVPGLLDQSTQRTPLRHGLIEKEGWRLLLLRRLYQVIIIAVPFIAATVIGLDEVPNVVGWQWKVAVLFMAITGLAFIYFKDKGYRPFFIIMLVLILRIAFNWFVMPLRQAADKGTIAKEQSIAIGEKYKDEKLGIYLNSKLDHTASFYISTERKKILHRGLSTDDLEMFLIVDTSRVEIPENYEVVDTFRKREDWKLMQIVQRK